MKKNTLKNLIATLMFCAAFLPTFAQNPMANLEKNYPQLTNLYRDDLGRYAAHYIFAIDVSGTMNKYADVVIPAIKPFFQALPTGDRVTVIPYGTDAKSSMPGFLGVINPDFKQSLSQDIEKLYTSPNYTREFKAYTNIMAAEEAIVDVIRANRSDYPVVVIIQVGDFRNDVKGERKLTQDELAKLQNSFAGVTDGLYTRVVALELPVDRNATGYCLGQLKESVFAGIGEEPNKGLEIVSMSTSQSAIKDWFERLKNDIMTTKLRAIVTMENKHADWATDLDVNIDGKVKGNSNWHPTRLYPNINIMAECLDKDFAIEVEEWSKSHKNKDEIRESDKIGKIRNKHWGFHKYDDAVRFHLEQPTDYDNELAALGIQKPISDVDVPVNKWIFTFFLPFWLTAIIAGLILLYLLMVIKAIKTNAAEHFKGTVDIYDSLGHQIGDTVNLNVKKNKPIIIGESGTNGCDVPGAQCAVVLEKETSSPLLFWKKPGFHWKARKGFARSGSKKQGLIGRYGGKMKKGFDIECGSGVESITHTLTLRIRK